MNFTIETLESHKDLGVLMSSNGGFEAHIEKVTKKIRQKIGWIMRSFYYRDINFMRQIFISLVRPHMDYRAQLWAPKEGPLLDKLEKLVYDYTKLIPEIRNLPYDERLTKMRLQSAQRRYERYSIIYTRKCITGSVPNIGISVRRDSKDRNGTKLEIPLSKETSSMRRNSIHIRGP